MAELSDDTAMFLAEQIEKLRNEITAHGGSLNRLNETLQWLIKEIHELKRGQR